MIEWYRELGTNERRTFWACFGGWALDALDVQIYICSAGPDRAVAHHQRPSGTAGDKSV